MFPFELGGESTTGLAQGRPAGEGVGLEEAEVTDGRVGERFQGFEAVEGEDLPAG
jgi:hypothetical protein